MILQRRSDTHTSLCIRLCIPVAAWSSNTNESDAKLQLANCLNRYVSQFCIPTAAISLTFTTTNHPISHHEPLALLRSASPSGCRAERFYRVLSLIANNLRTCGLSSFPGTFFHCLCRLCGFYKILFV